MKVLLLNGSPHQNGCTALALREVGQELQRLGHEPWYMWVGNKPVPGCIVCGGCKSGKCVYNDGVNEILAHADEFDALVVGSPVYYGCASGQIISFLDRLFIAAKGRLKGKIAACVVSCRRGGATSTFQQLNMFFGMNNLVVATSQYWNQIHGNTPEEAAQDAEGLQTMRTLARNIDHLLSRGIGKDHAEYEKMIATNFIR